MAARIAPAEKVARNLAAWFLAQGQYASAPANSGAAGGLVPAAAREPGLDAEFVRADLGGLAVQAVGHEVGVEEPKVRVYVSRGSRRALAKVPTADGEVAVQIDRVGALMIRPESPVAVGTQGLVFERDGRIACGSSCAPAKESYAGTIGALVRHNNGSSDLFLLSNNHIFAAGNHTPVGMPIMAPSMLDAGPNVRAPTEVGRHAEIEPLRSGEPNLVKPCQEDVALARVVAPDRVTSWQGDDTGYDTPTAPAALASGIRLQKFGRTTGRTTGVLEAVVKSPTPFPYRLRQFTGQVWFQDFWTVVGDNGEPFALQGDSGSLVVTEDGKRAAGLVFASDDRYGFIIPITHVLKCFGGISLVDKHGVGR